MTGREAYDDKITAIQLEEGDELHLTFAGGDEYIEVDSVRVIGEDEVEWTGSAWHIPRDLGDVLPADQEVWIKKRTASLISQSLPKGQSDGG